MTRLFSARSPAVGVRAIHLDLKGLPPSPRRLLQLLDLLAAIRVNAVLVEWEDTYPWRHPELRCGTAYRRGTVTAFLRKARKLGIEVIPLVQSFGHMENVLARKRFRHLREDPVTIGDICPSHPGAGAVIREMIEDLMATHAGFIRRMHLGGDEVRSLGQCPKCRGVVRKEGKAGLYLGHVLPLLDVVRSFGLQALLWDDMMRDWTVGELGRLGGKADLVGWSYTAQPFSTAPHRLNRAVMDNYRRAGIAVWGASAFKGADGANVDVALFEVRRANLLAWIEEARQRPLAGLIATGWSRYSTFTLPCESLESALVPLVYAAASMWDGSLPPDAEQQAMRFLSTGPVRRLAGKRHEQCLQASRELNEWRGRLDGTLRLLIRCAAVSAGEKGRCTPQAMRVFPETWPRYVKQGREIAARWRKAHAGLVPEVWLDHYIRSRLWLPDELTRALLPGARRRAARVSR